MKNLEHTTNIIKEKKMYKKLATVINVKCN